MTRLRRVRTYLIIGLALLAAASTSCASPPPALTDGPAVSPEFEDFWSRGGGLATFGPPISPARRSGGRLRQTFLAVEMILEEAASGGRVRLAPLGWDLGLAEPAVPPIDGQDEAYDSDTGHTVYAGFSGLYERLGGKEVAGGPISEVDFRDGQIVQYFENLGMHRPQNASPDEVRLIALGLTYRPPEDTFGLDPESLVLSGLVRQRPFDSFAAGFGGEALLGQPLTEPYFTDDGALEQVYERAVVFSPDGSRRAAALRPVGSELGPPAEAVDPSDEPGALYFDDTGHNVLWAFADFYRSHDGRRLVGLPLEEAWLQGDVMVQRFENAILTYRFDLPPQLAVQLAPLGRNYLAAHPAPTAEATDEAQEAVSQHQDARQEFVLEATLGDILVFPGQEQTILVRVSRPDGSPVAKASVSLLLHSTEGESTVTLESTDKNGRSSGSWRDEQASPGEIVNLQVTAAKDDDSGSVLLQYAYRYPQED